MRPRRCSRGMSTSNAISLHTPLMNCKPVRSSRVHMASHAFHAKSSKSSRLSAVAAVRQDYRRRHDRSSRRPASRPGKGASILTSRARVAIDGGPGSAGSLLQGGQAMRTLIEGGWVVAFNGKSHEIYEEGSVVFEDDRIVHAGGSYSGPADTRLSARGKLVSPGFINTHVHTTGNAGDYLLLDMAKNDYRTSNYMSFAAPLKGKMTPPPPEG